MDIQEVEEANQNEIEEWEQLRRSQEPEKFGFIYALEDPRTNIIRYVGRTTTLRVRFTSHLKDCHSREVEQWIKELHAERTIPRFRVLSMSPISSIANEEKNFIKKHSYGRSLLNSTYTKEDWQLITIRLPVSTIRELERMSGERKPDRAYPWKVQDIVNESLREYFTRLGRGQKKAA